MNGLKEILVADDEAGIRNALFDLLSDKGFSVTLAEDGVESLDQMKNRHFDLLITDVRMPRLTGLEVLKKMKEEGRTEQVIVMTGDPIRHSELGKDLQPVFTLLQKPFRLGSFLDVVSSALSDRTTMNPGSGDVPEVRQGCSIN
jgi:two-component system, NtrC family, response regulator HydG